MKLYKSYEKIEAYSVLVKTFGQDKIRDIEERNFIMSKSRCPHHIRHGTYNPKDQTIEYHDQCGLLMRRASGVDPTQNTRSRNVRTKSHLPPLEKGAPVVCDQVPFSDGFNYFACPHYQETFKSGMLKNNAVPMKDFQYSEKFSGSALGDMELL